MPILIMSMHINSIDIDFVNNGGANGCILKENINDTIGIILKDIYLGKKYVCHEVDKILKVNVIV